MQRRQFFSIGTCAVGAGLMATTTMSPAKAAETCTKGDQREKAKLRFSSQLRDWILPGGSEAERMAQLKKWGFEAVELGGLGDNYKNYKKMADDNGLAISAICWGSCNGDLCAIDDDARRSNGMAKLKEQLQRAGEIGAVGVIYVPAFNGQVTSTNQEIRKLLEEFLPEIGRFAEQQGTFVILEPLRRNEAFFMRQVADGASIARDCNRKGETKGIGVMGDSYHMYMEETDDLGAFISGGELLKHVHLGNGINRRLPGEPGTEQHCYVRFMRGLKYIGYHNFVSFECGVNGEAATAMPACLDFLRKSWDEA